MRRTTHLARRANYTMLMGLAIMVVVGFAAVAVDISLIAMGHMQSQAAADAASHAALVAHRNTVDPDMTVRENAARGAASVMLARNDVGLGSADLDAIRFGVYDAKNRTFCEGCGLGGTVNSVEVDVSRRGGNAMGLMLAPLIGVKTHDLASSATVAQQQRAIMLVQDFSCSMNSGAHGDMPIDTSRRASTLFLDYMTSYNQAGDMLGLAGYAEYGVRGPPRGEPNIGASIGGAFATLADLISQLFGRAEFSTDRPFAELSFVAEDQAYLRQMFAGICSSQDGCPDDVMTNTATETPYPPSGDIGTCTNPAIAMRQAIDELVERADPSYFRGIVVMSDGAFNCRGGPTAAVDAADYAWNTHGIHIWTVLFFRGGGSPGQMKQLIRGYGSFSQTPSVAELPEIYAGIAASLPTAIVD